MGRPSNHSESTRCHYDKNDLDPIEISDKALEEALESKKYFLQCSIRNQKLQELYDLIIYHDFIPKWFAVKDSSSQKTIYDDTYYDTNEYGTQTAAHTETTTSYDCKLYLVADSSESFKHFKKSMASAQKTVGITIIGIICVLFWLITR